MSAASLPRPAGRFRVSDWRLLKTLIPYGRPYARTLLLGVLLLIPLSAAGAVQPILVGQGVSLLRGEATLGFLAGRPVSVGINIIALLLTITISLRLSLQAVQSWLVQQVGQRITADIRNDLFRHVLSLPMAYFDRTPVGKIITRISSDVEALGDVFATGAVGIFIDLFTLLGLAAAMLWQQWFLGLLLLGLLVPVTMLVTTFQAQYRRANYQSREELSRLNATLQETIQGIGVIQLFRRETYNAGLFRGINRSYVAQVDKTIYFDSAISATLEWIALVAIALVLLLGGWLVLGADLPFGVLAAFILFAQRLFDPLRELAEKFTLLQSGFTAIERIREVLQQPVTIADPPQPQSLPIDGGGEIRFEHVSLAYKTGEPVLQDLDLRLQPGEKVALVGPTGAGKSSVIRLLCRLYEPTAGRVLLDGVDIRQLTQETLRQAVGVILQDPFLFAGDVYSNITLGENYRPAEVTEVVERLGIQPFIQDLPQGLHTQVRQRGTNLSTGQKQLIAFARVAIRNPRVLVLDEATASLDVGTEAILQAALEQLLAGRTAIVIAHRLATIRNVDRILVLKQGQLVEQGTHADLLAQEGLYAYLYRLQFSRPAE